MLREETGDCSNEEDEGKVCRVCLTLVKLNFSLFEPYLQFTPFDVINQLFGVTITLDDNLPSAICQTCLSELEVIVNFKQKYEQSDFYLRSNIITEPADTTVKTELVKQEKEKDENLDIASFEVEVDSCCNDDLSTALDEDNASGIETATTEYKTVHKLSLSKVFQCNDCQQIFNTKFRLKTHWKRNHEPKSHTCTRCKRVFKSLRSFKNHNLQEESCTKNLKNITIQGTGKNRIFCCVFCEYKSNAIAKLKPHLLIHTGDKPFGCKICQKSYSQPSSLSLHKQSAHPDSKTEVITCHVCAKTIRGKYRYTNHMRRAHGDKQYQCDTCKLFLKTKCSLVCHLQKHANLRQYVCDVCGEAFNVSADLGNHKKRRHESIFHNCTECGYRAKKKKAFQRHSLLHTNKKLSQCAQCYRFYECPLKLHKHIKECHEKFNGILHTCRICNKSFARKDVLTTHEKRHKLS